MSALGWAVVAGSSRHVAEALRQGESKFLHFCTVPVSSSPDGTPNPSVVQELERLLEAARAGEIIGLAGSYAASRQDRYLLVRRHRRQLWTNRQTGLP